MKISIVGAGKVGTALGRGFVRAGHSVVYASRSRENSRKAAEAVGGSAAGSLRECVQDADMVVLAIPYASAREVASEIAPVIGNKIVVDVCNPVGSDGNPATHGVSAAEEYAEWMPGARVAKAFNTIFSKVQNDPNAHGVLLDAFFAVDDQAAAAVIGDLMESLGFRSVHVGPLVRARELEALAFLNIKLQAAFGGDWRTAFVAVGAPSAALERPVQAGVASRQG